MSDLNPPAFDTIEANGLAGLTPSDRLFLARAIIEHDGPVPPSPVPEEGERCPDCGHADGLHYEDDTLVGDDDFADGCHEPGCGCREVRAARPAPAEEDEGRPCPDCEGRGGMILRSPLSGDAIQPEACERCNMTGRLPAPVEVEEPTADALDEPRSWQAKPVPSTHEHEFIEVCALDDWRAVAAERDEARRDRDGLAESLRRCVCDFDPASTGAVPTPAQSSGDGHDPSHAEVAEALADTGRPVDEVTCETPGCCASSGDGLAKLRQLAEFMGNVQVSAHLQTVKGWRRTVLEVIAEETREGERVEGA